MKKIIFLISTCLVVLCISTIMYAGTAVQKKHIGIATYSVKGLESDIEGSFKALAADGYVVMEISNYDALKRTVAGYKPADYAALAKKYGMEIISSHARAKFDVKDVKGTLAEWGKIFDDHKAMGCKYVIFPMNFWSGTVAGLKAECDLLNSVGDEANKRGLKFGYHNHNFEFAKVPGTDQFYEDFLITNTNPAKVFFQMDVYWVTIGGQDPVVYLKKYPDRFKVLHIKDDYVVGESGTIDYKAIYTQFYKNNGQDWFVEMEAKMTPEEKKQVLAGMEQMKKSMAEGKSITPAGPPPSDQKNAGNQQGGKSGQNAVPAALAASQQLDPKVIAETLKTSLEGLKQSALYLIKADFVK